MKNFTRRMVTGKYKKSQETEIRIARKVLYYVSIFNTKNVNEKNTHLEE